MEKRLFRIEWRTDGLPLPGEDRAGAVQALIRAIPDDWAMVLGQISNPSCIHIGTEIGMEIRADYNVEFVCPPEERAALMPFLIQRHYPSFIRFNETGLRTSDRIGPAKLMIAEYLKRGYHGHLTFIGRMPGIRVNPCEWCRLNIIDGPGAPFPEATVELGFDPKVFGEEKRLEHLYRVVAALGMREMTLNDLPLTTET